MMLAQGTLRRPQLAGYTAVALLTATGGLLFFTLVLEVHPPAWSRSALGLQALAMALALLLTYWHRPPRFFLYPIVLAGVIYLWDTTLPPPSLPDGPLRWLVPRAVLVSLLADLVITLRRWRVPPRKATRIYHGYMALDGVAQVLDTTSSDLRLRLRCASRAPIVGSDGTEYLSLDDLYIILARWHQRNDRHNGHHNGAG
jgi:hypothetical protein